MVFNIIENLNLLKNSLKRQKNDELTLTMNKQLKKYDKLILGLIYEKSGKKTLI